MDRRAFLRLGAAVPVSIGAGVGPAFSAPSSAPSSPADPYPASAGWRVYELTTEVHLPAAAAPATVWLPVPAPNLGDYQHTVSNEWIAPGARARAARTGRYGVDMLVIDWPTATHGAPLSARLTSTVALRDRDVDLGTAPSLEWAPSARSARSAQSAESAASLAEYRRPTQLMPTDGIVRETALGITAGLTDDMSRAQAIYQWVVDHTCRDASVRGCGTGDVVRMLKTGGVMNGKCADINGLFVALTRAVGIPARDAYGIRVDDSQRGFRALGKAGDISRAQHCRAEFHAAGYGWIPADPADVRKVALEEVPGGLPMTDGKVRAARALLFGAWEGNWVAYNHGHDVRLPDSGMAPVPFLMYPQAKTVAGTLDSLDPAAFGYRIASRRVA
ncbi:Transglutaminase-like enzyme, putative cysteine protease [Ralstonia sp. 25mfcol4.1]|uniref:transglutaminase-like domain-containing protein n=1 Tax=Burkholderiaceae TaxID=119060 RepID=UPI000885920D|nr:transglutaminase family protein [Ralstonia sp. 25mfcol4.1]SDP10339.1 Transglutaminase-like enzyme, putative cysteine protease [Ralstonia sp. 25mfcol4.1]